MLTNGQFVKFYQYRTKPLSTIVADFVIYHNKKEYILHLFLRQENGKTNQYSPISFIVKSENDDNKEQYIVGQEYKKITDFKIIEIKNKIGQVDERAGSGVPNIFNVWEDEGWIEPVIEERFDPDRTVLSLSFQKKATEKTQSQYNTILWYKAGDLVKVLDVKETRTKELLRNLVEEGMLIDNGVTKGKKYKKN